MKKRIFSLITALCVMVSMLPTMALTASTASISSTKDRAKAGDTFDVSLIIPSNDAKKAYSASFSFSYNDSIFEVTNFSAPKIGDIDASGNNAASGTVSCTYSGKLGGNTLDFSSGLTVTATFKVKDSAAPGSYEFAVDKDNTYAVELDETDYSTEYPLFEVPDGLKTAVIVYSELTDEQTITMGTLPAAGAAIGTVAATGTNFTVAFSDWKKGSDSVTTFAASTEYTATGTLTASDGYIFANEATVTVSGTDNGTAANPQVIDGGKKLTFTYSYTTPALPPYSGTAATAPTLSTKSGGNVTLSAVTMSGETVEYGWSHSASVQPTTWQDDVNFTGLAAGDYYFFARVKAKAGSHSGGGVSNASTAITVYEKPKITGYGSLGSLVIGTAVNVSPTATVPAGLSTSNPYSITGTLPAGLSFSQSDGKISGTPTTYSTSGGSVTITVTDAEGTVSDAYTLTYSAVAKKAQTITASDMNVTYGDTDKSVSATSTDTSSTISYAVKEGFKDYITVGTSDGKLTIKKAGEAWVVVTAAATDECAEATKQVKVTISPKNVTAAMIGAIADQPYTGSAITPKPAITDGSATLTESTDFAYSYSNNTYAGTSAKVEITGRGNYTGSADKTFTISAIDVSTLTATAPDQTTVAGVGTFNDPTITGVNSESVTGTFKYAYGSEADKSHDDVVNMLKTKSANDEVTLTYTFTPSNSNYTGTKTGSFKITVKDIEFKVSGAAASADNAINSLTDDTVYGKNWNERISVKSGSITASVGGTVKEGTYTIVPESGTLTDRPGVGTKSYTVKFSSTDGAYSDVTVFTGSITVIAKPVTITGLSVDNKEYDGNTTATVNGTAAISGKVGSDDVTVTAGTATFADKNVGTGKIVTFSGYSLSGADASNYSLSQPASVTANITAKGVSVTVTATNRDYVSGNRNVALVAGSVTGVIGSDTVNVDVSGATGTLENENAGTDKSVTVTGVTLSGTDAGNYNLTAQPTGVTVTINQITWTNTSATGSAKYGTTGSVDLSSYLAPGGSFGTITVTDADSVLSSTPTMDGNALKFTFVNEAGKAGKTATISVPVTDATNYNDYTINVTVTVNNKTTPTVTAPTSKAGLVYNGADQVLINAGSTTGGTLQYSLTSGSSYSTELPKAENAGTYTVYYKVIGNDDYADVAENSISVSVAKRTISVKADNKSMTVNGTLPTFTVSYGNFASGDSEANVIETKANASCAAAGTSTGSFTITVDEATVLKSGMDTNYQVGTPENGTLTVNPAYYGGGGGSVTTYSVTVGKAENGTVSVSPKSAAKGSTVTVTVAPDKGYTLETLTVLAKDGKELKLTEKDGKYTFTMPAGAVEVKATFMDDNTMLNFFVDVKPGDFFYEAVLWAVKNGITNGISATEFGPNLSCTRAQIVTFLWRAAGSPEPKGTGSFADVPAGSYYAKAVAWAVENGITGGTGDGQFSPDATCTREQAVTFLYRASDSPSVSGGSAFSDVAANAYYADAVAWAEKNEITGGIGGGLFGSGNDCTRGQIVTLLYRAYQGK